MRSIIKDLTVTLVNWFTCPSLYPFCNHFIHTWVTAVYWNFIPAVKRREMGYTLNGSPASRFNVLLFIGEGRLKVVLVHFVKAIIF